MQTPDAFDDFDLRSLRYAEHFSIWAIRTTVACSPLCRTLMREFHSAFGPNMDEGRAAYQTLVEGLARGARKVWIGRPGHITLTSDELCMMLMLAAGQYEDQDRFCAHARWIMGHERLDDLYVRVRRYTDLLRARGHWFRTPPPQTPKYDVDQIVSETPHVRLRNLRA